MVQRTNLTALLLARDEASLQAKRVRLAVPDPFRGYLLTVAQAADLIGRYEQAGSQLFITSFWRNDQESLELFATEVMPHFVEK